MPKNPSELLKPTEVYAEYGIKVRALAYMREQTEDIGHLIGPYWINPPDTEIYYYKRIWIDDWMTRDQCKFNVPTLQNDKSNKSEENITNIHKFQKNLK